MSIWQHPVHGPILLLVDVDDMAVAAMALAGLSGAEELVLSTYEGRDLGASNTLLGMRIYRDRAASTLALSCPGVTAALLEQLGTGTARQSKLPLAANTTLKRTGEHLLVDSTQYSELAGSLRYLATTTRPDIAYATGVLARYMNNPEVQHWTAATGVLRYFSTTPKHELL